MTTFTLQDLGVSTPEEEEAFKALAQELTKHTQPTTEDVVNNIAIPQPQDNNIIQGATGAQYEAINLKQFEGHLGTGKADAVANASMQHELNHLTVALRNLITAIAEQQAQANQQKQPVSSSSADLQGAVDVVLQQAEWFKGMVEKAVEDTDLDELVSEAVADKVDNEVEHYFNYNFSLEDHVDVADLVSDAVDNRLEDIVNEKLDEILEDALKEKLANITISFN